MPSLACTFDRNRTHLLWAVGSYLIKALNTDWLFPMYSTSRHSSYWTVRIQYLLCFHVGSHIAFTSFLMSWSPASVRLRFSAWFLPASEDFRDARNSSLFPLLRFFVVFTGKIRVLNSVCPMKSSMASSTESSSLSRDFNHFDCME